MTLTNIALAYGSQRSVPTSNLTNAQEWINEIPTCPYLANYLAKPQPRERARQNQRGKKTPLSLTLFLIYIN
jgi:hypothetical protein